MGNLIGKGYSSRVYKGRNDKTGTVCGILGEDVAIKVIDMKPLEERMSWHMLQSEIKILRLLRFHSGILHLEEVYTTKNNTYIVTELCRNDMS